MAHIPEEVAGGALGSRTAARVGDDDFLTGAEATAATAATGAEEEVMMVVAVATGLFPMLTIEEAFKVCAEISGLLGAGGACLGGGKVRQALVGNDGRWSVVVDC